ncbi:ABC-2 transporter permease [Actinomycetaceae bacterium L2_0104]
MDGRKARLRQTVNMAWLELVVAFGRPLLYLWLVFDVMFVGLTLTAFPFSLAGLMAPLVITIWMVLVLFQNDDIAKLGILHSILPVGRRDVVAGRYLAIAAIVGAQLVVGVVATAILSARFPAPTLSEVVIVACVGFAVVGVYVAITFPILFALVPGKGAAPARFVSIFVTCGLFGVFFGKVQDWHGPAMSLNTLALAVVVVSAALVTLSIPLSQRIYSRKDF